MPAVLDWWHCDHCGHDNMPTHGVRNRQPVYWPAPKFCRQCGADQPIASRHVDGEPKLVFCEGKDERGKCGCHYLDTCPQHGDDFLRDEAKYAASNRPWR